MVEIEFPFVTPEQYERFSQEFAQYWDSLDHGPDGHIGNRSAEEEAWCLARAYSEMQMQNLLSDGGLQLGSTAVALLQRQVYELERKLPERNFAKGHSFREWLNTPR